MGVNQGGAWGEGSRRGAVSTEALRLGREGSEVTGVGAGALVGHRGGMTLVLGILEDTEGSSLPSIAPSLISHEVLRSHGSCQHSTDSSSTRDCASCHFTHVTSQHPSKILQSRGHTMSN